MRHSQSLFGAMVLGLVGGCSPYPHSWLDHYAPPTATPMRDYEPSEDDFRPKALASMDQSSKDHNDHAAKVDRKNESSYLFTEVFSDGSRRLYGNTSGSVVDYNSQIVIYPNNAKLKRLAEDLWSPADKSKIRAVVELKDALKEYLAAAQKSAGSVIDPTKTPTPAKKLENAYDSVISLLPPEKDHVTAKPNFTTANTPTAVDDVGSVVVDLIHNSWRMLRQLRDQKMGSIGTLKITASLTPAGKSKSTPLHVSNYDTNNSTVNNSKGIGSGQPAPSDSSPSTSTPLNETLDKITGPTSSSNATSTISEAAFAVALAEPAAPATAPEAPAPAAPAANDPTAPATLPKTTAKAQSAANDPTVAGSLAIDPAKAPPGIIDLHDTPADRGDIIKITGTLTAPTKDGTTTIALNAPPALEDPFDLSVDRLDWSLKFTGNMIFVNQIKGNSFTPSGSAALTLHYHPFIGSEVITENSGDDVIYKTKRPDAFWQVWNAIDPAVGLDVAAVGFNANSSSNTGKGATSTSGSVEVGVGVQISAFSDLLQIGYGYDLQANHHPRYWFVGISVLDALNQIGGLGLTVKK